MASTSELYNELLQQWRKALLLASCASQLSWDEQTNLPPGGAAHRAEQLSLLAGLVHERLTSPRLGELIGELARATTSADRKAQSEPMCGRRSAAMTVPRSCQRGLWKRFPA